MGCPICLDTFGEDTEKGTRPVALPCGHVFHKACSDGWLKACRGKGDSVSCPLCKKELGTSHALPLWPSDVSDLDMYMANRSRRMEQQRNRSEAKPAPATLALDRCMSRDAQAALLGKLIDFRQHVGAYVMAVNNVSMSAYGGEDRVFRLFRDASRKSGDGREEEEFRRTLEALTGAVTTLEREIGRTEHARALQEGKAEETQRNFEKSESMRKSYQQHMERKAMEEQRMNEEAQRTKRLTLHLKRELQEVERKKEAMERERLSYVNEARQKANEAMKARLESAQIVAQSRGDAESKVSELNKYVQEQERLRIQAEDRAREEKKKAGWLADRNKLLSGKLDAKRKELTALQEKLAQGGLPTEQASSASAAASASSKAKGKARAIEQDDQSQDADVKLEWPLTPSASDDKQSWSSQPDWHRSSNESKADHHDTVVILDDDLDDDDLDDSSYMMPSFSRTVTSAYTKPGATIMLPGDKYRTTTRPREEEDDDLDDSVELVSVVKRPKHRTEGNATANFSPRRSSRSHNTSAASTSGVANMLPGNETLYSRITSGSMLFGPRRRAK